MYTFYDLTIECIHSTTFYILYNIYTSYYTALQLLLIVLNRLVETFHWLSLYRNGHGWSISKLSKYANNNEQTTTCILHFKYWDVEKIIYHLFFKICIREEWPASRPRNWHDHLIPTHCDSTQKKYRMIILKFSLRLIMHL